VLRAVKGRLVLRNSLMWSYLLQGDEAETWLELDLLLFLTRPTFADRTK